MHLNQTGATLYIYTQFTMTGFTTLQILMTHPNGTTVSLNPTLGTVPLTIPDGTIWPANQYVYYTFQSGDLIYTGTHQVQVIYNNATQEIPSNPTFFVVYP